MLRNKYKKKQNFQHNLVVCMVRVTKEKLAIKDASIELTIDTILAGSIRDMY